MKNIFYQIALLYWRIFKPSTFGVKVLIHANGSFLLIRNSYDTFQKWNIPGGKYNPRKETSNACAIREVMEELGIDLDPVRLLKLQDYYSEAEYKKDTVSIFLYDFAGEHPTIKRNFEISNYDWFTKDEISKINVFRIVKYALEASTHI